MWFKDYTLEMLNNRPKNHLGAYLGITFTGIGADFLEATMPVNEKTHQPAGILHGGASAALAESIGSVASGMVIDPEKSIVVGLEINANHLRPVKSGYVKARCSPLHIGSKTHVWDIKIYDENGKMNCVSRLTVAVLNKETS